MTRIMIDCIHDNLMAVLPAINTLQSGDLVAGYGTGGSEIEWTTLDWDHIKSSLEAVIIDQDFGPDVPLKSANVIDSEGGAWSPGQIDERMAQSTAERPTLYSAQDNLDTIASTEKWRGDLWLAKIGPMPTAIPVVPHGFNVVAQQYAQGVNGLYDLSVVFDPYWPLKGPEMTPQLPPGPWNPDENYPWKGAILTVIGSDGLIHAYEYDLVSEKWNRLDTVADTK